MRCLRPMQSQKSYSRVKLKGIHYMRTVSFLCPDSLLALLEETQARMILDVLALVVVLVL